MAAEAIGKSQKTKNRVATVLMVIFFTILAILIILPIYAIILASFKPGNHLLQYGLNLDLDSASMTLSNYVLLFTGQHDYWIWFRNSLFLTVVTVVLTLLVSAFVAYGFAAYDFKIGTIRRKKIPYSVAPSIRPASIRDFGVPSRYCLKKKIVDACARNGSTTAT